MEDLAWESLAETTRGEIALAMNNKRELDFYTKFNAVTLLEELMRMKSRKICDDAKGVT
jgi:hypothetical protein